MTHIASATAQEDPMLFQIIHLLMSLQNSRSKSSLSSNPQREIKSDPVPIDCPTCKTITVANHFIIEERTTAKPRPIWTKTTEVYQCSNCSTRFLTTHFENPGTGILQMKSSR